MTEKWEKLSLGWILVRKWLVITGQREFILKLSQNGRQTASFFESGVYQNEDTVTALFHIKTTLYLYLSLMINY